MYPELTNLLPPARERAFRRVYFLRLLVVVLFLFCGVIIAHAVLLVPTYLYTLRETDREQAQLSSLSSSLQTSEEQQVSARLSALRANVSFLNGLTKQSTASAALRAVFAVPHAGITVSGITFTPAGQGGSGANANASAQMVLTGMASTRDTLRAYVQALSQLPFVSSADLPISAYAKDSNIPFTVTLTGNFKV